MNFLLLLPAITSFLLLGAHFYRAAQIPMVGLALLLPLLLFLRRAWVVYVIQVVLMLGMLEWIRTLFVMVDLRRELGQPWTRLAIIIGGVALFTGCSALLLQSKRLRQRYKLTE